LSGCKWFLLYFCLMTTAELSTFIRNEALLLGFGSCGFAQACALPESERIRFEEWLREERQGEMSYMSRNLEKRLNPTLLLEGCRSVVVVALNYFPLQKQKPEAPKVARFAYGRDYHGLIRAKLYQLLEALRKQDVAVNGRAFSDSAPVAERFWAAQAGLGWIGKNKQLILPGKGSYYLLGELMLDLELEYGKPLEPHCGKCHRCLDACPTKALDGKGLDARKCLSCLTIEKKGPFTSEESNLMKYNPWVFGCDLCQEACPWNHFAQPNSVPEFQPSEEFLSLDWDAFSHLTPDYFTEIFTGTCLERTGLEGLQRNLEAKK
jgi:epoxyqueuosine reductase